MPLSPLDPTMTIAHLERRADRDPWRAPFVAAYTRIFKEPPYEEDISDKQAGRVWDELTNLPDSITLIATTPPGDLAGFGIAVPIRFMRNVSTVLAGLIPTKHTMYLAELGVLPEHRQTGLGHALVFERLKRMNPALYSHVVLRVAESRNRSLEMYKALGFEDMGVHMEVPALRLDGEVRSDRRVFLSRVLSQTDVE